MKQVWQSIKDAWMKFAKALGWVNTRILLTATYILFAPAAIVLAILRKDLLLKRFSDGPSYWVSKEKPEHSLETAKHQF